MDILPAAATRLSRTARLPLLAGFIPQGKRPAAAPTYAMATLSVAADS